MGLLYMHGYGLVMYNVMLLSIPPVESLVKDLRAQI